jgi:hypothetical protein
MKYFFLLLALAFAPMLGADPIALGDGEMLKYRVGWGIFGGAGEIVINAHAESDEGLPTLAVSTKTVTRGFIRTIYPFDGDAESLFDGRDGRLLAAKATTSAGKRKTKAMAVFNYSSQNVRYVDYFNPNRSATLPLPPGPTMDLITSLVQTRSWAMKPGDRRPALVMFDDEFYDLTIIADHYENVHTPWGDVQALVLVPVMETNPKGMFRKGGRVKVWISQDQKRLPVKFEVALNFGTAVASLVEYHPVGHSPDTAHADTHP